VALKAKDTEAGAGVKYRPYRVTFYVRNEGAIGVYWPKTFEVMARRGTGDGGATKMVLASILKDGTLEPDCLRTQVDAWVPGWFPEHSRAQVWEWGWMRIPWQPGYGYIETLEDEEAVKAGHYKVRAR